MPFSCRLAEMHAYCSTLSLYLRPGGIANSMLDGRWSRCSNLWLVTALNAIASPVEAATQLSLADSATRTIGDAPSAAYLARCSLTTAAQSPVVVRRKQHREMDAGARGRSSAPTYGWIQHYARCQRLWEAAARLSFLLAQPRRQSVMCRRLHTWRVARLLRQCERRLWSDVNSIAKWMLGRVVAAVPQPMVGSGTTLDSTACGKPRHRCPLLAQPRGQSMMRHRPHLRHTARLLWQNAH